MTVGEDFVSGTCRRVATVPPDTNPNSAPAFFITFFLYGPHRHTIPIVGEFPESATSRTAPVSTDGPILRRKTIFGGSLTSRRQVDDKQTTSRRSGKTAPEKCTPNRRILR